MRYTALVTIPLGGCFFDPMLSEPKSILVVAIQIRVLSKKCHIYIDKMRTLSQQRKDRRLRQKLAISVKGESRVTKSAAADKIGISRRTIIRYAQSGLISEDRRGRVRIGQICRVLTDVGLHLATALKGLRYNRISHRLHVTQTNGIKREQIENLSWRSKLSDGKF